MDLTIHFTTTKTETLSISVDDIMAYMDRHPEMFTASESFPLPEDEDGDEKIHSDYMDEIRDWIGDNTVILEEVGSPDEANAPDYSVDEVEEG